MKQEMPILPIGTIVLSYYRGANVNGVQAEHTANVLIRDSTTVEDIYNLTTKKANELNALLLEIKYIYPPKQN